ncbi:MAG: GLPGLI family protein [Flavobacteriales bacterium]|nr:GLPGLI family protein [Flavobacteriales bacterium]
MSNNYSIKTTTLFTVTLLIFQLAFSQDFQGVATYQFLRISKNNTERSVINFESSFNKSLYKALESEKSKVYKLVFNRETSIYKEDESLESPRPDRRFKVKYSYSKNIWDLLFKNINENRIILQNEFFGKKFLIKSKLNKLSWTLVNESKMIGNYRCYKAYLKNENVRNPSLVINYDRERKDENEKIENSHLDEDVTVAWYAPDIPISNGPSDYHGLPGLILEVSNNELIILCSKIVLNPKNKVKISEPSKGKKVTLIEYNKIVSKRLKGW